MKNAMKISLLYIAKYLGIFKISRYLTRNKLRIFCYHGFNKRDEVLWRPGLFIKKESFDARLRYMKQCKYSVLPLSEAVEKLKSNKLPHNATVITIDDGWSGTHDIAHPLLRKWKLPYTVYVTSYYSQKQSPLFNIVVPFLFWNSQHENVKLEPPLVPVQGTFPTIGSESLQLQIIEFGQSRLNDKERVETMRYLGRMLSVDYDRLEKERIFHLLSLAELKTLAAEGVDLQLHAHRHRWPIDEKQAILEIEENRNFLEPIVNRKKLKHFCYPSGIWAESQLPFLKKAGIESATTCDHGFNSPGDNCLCLKRILDGEDKQQIEFEAEISGFKELVRWCYKRVYRDG